MATWGEVGANEEIATRMASEGVGGSTLPTDAAGVLTNDGAGNLSWEEADTPGAHSETHEASGVDEIDVTGLSGELADPQPPKAHAASHADGEADELDITSLAGYSGSADDALRGDGTWGEVASGDAWTEVAAGSDQDVTNNSTMQDDTALTFAVTAGLYHGILMLRYSGSDGTPDFKWDFSCPALSGWYKHTSELNVGGSAAAVNTGTMIAAGSTSFPASPAAIGTKASHGACVSMIEFMVEVTASGSITFRFANNTSGTGNVSRRKAGSLLRYRKVA